MDKHTSDALRWGVEVEPAVDGDRLVAVWRLWVAGDVEATWSVPLEAATS